MKLVMMGTGTFAEPTFEAMLQSPHAVVGLFTQPDRAVGQERGSTRQTGKGMKTIAQEKGIAVFQPESVNTPESIAALHSLQPDLLVVAAYGQILKPDVLAAAKLGGINVHASLLPKYRGAAPIAWAIYHGEKQTGVTIIQMSPQLDGGGMILQAVVDIDKEETAGGLEARLAPLGGRLALQAIEQIVAGTARPISQDKSQVTKAPKLKKEDGLIDWTKDAWTVCNQIRAMQPWPTAFSFYHRPAVEPLRAIIHRAWAFDNDDLPEGAGTPGAPGVLIHQLSPHALWAWTANDSGVKILELQPAGKKRMSAVDFLRGHPIKEGDRFGPEKLDEKN